MNRVYNCKVVNICASHSDATRPDIVILYIKMNVCLFVWNLYKSTFLNRYWTKLCTPLPLGLEEVVGYVWTHNIPTFAHFRPILPEASADSSTEDGSRRHTSPLLRYIRDAARDSVTLPAWRPLCVMHRKRREVNGMHVCENGNLMRREGSK
jgi:hypothetical protein